MKNKSRWQVACTGGLGLVLAALTGCQTWVAGMTLPSGDYLRHAPQYFPASPQFPLNHELADMQGTGQAAPQGAPPAPVAPPPPPAPVSPNPAP